MTIITIKTRLDTDIYASQGGGQVKTHYSYTTGPRNLLSAIAQLRAHRVEMEQGFGNIGCGASWLEIAGVCIDQMDLDDVARDDAGMYSAAEIRDGYAHITPRTTKARTLIASVHAGTYDAAQAFDPAWV